MPLPYVSDSRRLTGASLFLPVPGAILEVAAPTEIKTKLRVYWRHWVKKLLQRIGWSDALVVTRDQGPSQILAISAPIDGLLAATHITEWAWEAALAKLKLARAASLNEATDRILGRIAREARPPLAALYRAAVLRRVPVFLSEQELSLGEGANSKVFTFDDLPEPSQIAWRPKMRRVPKILVTGTNGKTTTVRLLARMLSTAGNVVGFCSTDFVQVGADILERDDYSGPTGARIVLRHPDTETAVLEVARGGMLRRGLQVIDGDVGVVTNVANDHLGENGIHTLAQLAEAKFTIVRGLREDAPVVVNADDEHCRAYARKLTHPICWFGFERPSASITRGRAPRAGLVYLEQEHFCIELDADTRYILADVADCPLSLRGSARYNVANMLAATAAAVMLGCPLDAIVSALLHFGKHPADNPGRANVYPIRGAQVLVDYGHNPDGISAILDSAAVLGHKRLLIGVGMPGDRSDEAAVAVGERVAQAKASHVIVKELAMYLRGRPEGELSGILRKSLKANGYPEKKTGYVRTDAELVERALQWLKPGDLAVLFLHENVSELSALLLAASEFEG
jgi:cyanophycin synthetase